MAAKDLITLARAYNALQGVTNQDALLTVLITAASDAIQKYCRRDFAQTSSPSPVSNGSLSIPR
jgi:hypothetical protein